VRMTTRVRGNKVIASRLGDLVAGVCFALIVIAGGAALVFCAMTPGGDLLIAAGFYAVIAAVLLPFAVRLIARWRYLVLDFDTHTYRLKCGLRSEVRTGKIDSRLRVVLRHERRLSRGHAMFTIARPYDAYSVVVDGVYTEPIVLGEWRSQRRAERFAKELAEACRLEPEEELQD